MYNTAMCVLLSRHNTEKSLFKGCKRWRTQCQPYETQEERRREIDQQSQDNMLAD